MKPIRVVFKGLTVGAVGLFLFLSLGALVISIAQAVSPEAHAAVEDFNARVAETVQKVESKIETAQFAECRETYLANTECTNIFSVKVCEAEVLKACDEKNPNYHGKVPEPLIQKGE